MLSWCKGEVLSMRQSQCFHLEADVPSVAVFERHLHEALEGLVEDLARRGRMRAAFLISAEIEQDHHDYRWVVRAFDHQKNDLEDA